MPNLALRQDFALWLSLLKRHGPARGLTEPLAIYHHTPGSLSSNRKRAVAASWRMYREEVGLGRWRAAAYLATNLLRRLRRG
jgi:teichuronic acid biosynthesis glycosyltransferase TuaG